MLHDPGLMYRSIQETGGGRQGPWPVYWADEEICHYPLWAIPLTLPRTWPLITMRIQQTLRCSITVRAVSQLSPEIHRIFFMKQVLKNVFPKGVVIFQKKINFYYSSFLQHPVLSTIHAKLTVKILYINSVTCFHSRLRLIMLHFVLTEHYNFVVLAIFQNGSWVHNHLKLRILVFSLP